MIIDLTKAECETLVHELNYGHLGCCDGEEPYVVPITYVYHGGFFYDFTQEGKKIDVLRKNPNMCIQIERVKSEQSWESVICWGRFEEVTDEKVTQDIKLMLAERHGEALISSKGRDAPFTPLIENLNRLGEDEAKKVVIYRMQPYRITGKAERV